MGCGLASAVVRALSRLGAGMNISHLFLLHYISGFLLDAPIEASLLRFCTATVATLVCAACMSLPVYLAIEAPCMMLVVNPSGLQRAAPMSSVQAATSKPAVAHGQGRRSGASQKRR